MTYIFYMKRKEYIDDLFPYAYNILGSAEDAKDVIQDAMVKYLEGERREIEFERNYLIKSVVNAAINLKTRQRKIHSTIEVWLPEPVATSDMADRNLYLKDVLSYSLLVLMERLAANERAVFLLKETFDYTHVEIANILGITQVNSRKLLSRAKKNLFKPPAKGRTEGQNSHDRNVLLRFVRAIRQRDTVQLENAMHDDIRFYADGGGKIPLLAVYCNGALQVAALLVKIYTLFLHSARMEFTEINHQPALLAYNGDSLNSCHVFDLQPKTDKVLQINVVLDPDKLKSLNS